MIEFLRNLFVQDKLLKLFSLALAMLIWLTVTVAIHREVGPPTPGPGLRLVERTFSKLPVVILSAASDVRSFHVNPDAVDVTVRGDVRTLQALQPKDLRALVDLTGVESARDLLKRIEVSTPAGVTYVRAVPHEVQVLMPPKS